MRKRNEYFQSIKRKPRKINATFLEQLLIQTHGLTEERKELFDALKNELYAHSVAEDRYLYIPLMFDDVGLDITRHALYLNTMKWMSRSSNVENGYEVAQVGWQPLDSYEKSPSPLKRRRHKFLQQAGKILKDSEKETLGNKYLKNIKYKKRAISYTYDAVFAS